MPHGWESAGRLLCVRLDSLGDVLMTQPAIRALKGAVAGRRITLLTSPAGAEAARLVPEIDDVIVYEAPWMKATPPRPSPAHDFAMIDRLRDGRFDGAVLFTVSTQDPLPAAMLTYLAGIPLRAAHCAHNPYQLLSDSLPERDSGPEQRHEVRRQLCLVAALGSPSTDERMAIAVPPAARVAVREMLATHGIGTGDLFAVIHPGASAPSRRYEPGRFRAVAGALEAAGARCIVTGDPGERELAQAVAGGSAVNLAGLLELPALAAAIEASSVLVTNNTGPAHIAAATGTPVVVVYARTNPQHTPWMVPSRVLSRDVACSWCLKSVCPEGTNACLDVPPGEVAGAALELMGMRVAGDGRDAGSIPARASAARAGSPSSSPRRAAPRDRRWPAADR